MACVPVETVWEPSLSDWKGLVSFKLTRAGDNVSVEMTTTNFQVVYGDGKASIHLWRHLTSKDLRVCANKMKELANELDEAEAWGRE